MHLSGTVVNTSDYESAGLSLILDKRSRRTVHPANWLISTTGSKVNVTGDERLQLRAATVCTRSLPYILS